jgi:hypothetical protein
MAEGTSDRCAAGESCPGEVLIQLARVIFLMAQQQSLRITEFRQVSPRLEI